MNRMIEPCLCGDPECGRCFPQYPDEPEQEQPAAPPVIAPAKPTTYQGRRMLRGAEDLARLLADLGGLVDLPDDPELHYLTKDLVALIERMNTIGMRRAGR